VSDRGDKLGATLAQAKEVPNEERRENNGQEEGRPSDRKVSQDLERRTLRGRGSKRNRDMVRKGDESIVGIGEFVYRE